MVVAPRLSLSEDMRIIKPSDPDARAITNWYGPRVRL